MLKAHMKTSTTKELEEKAWARLKKHNKIVMCGRYCYYAYKIMSEQYPKEYLSIIHDKMDKTKTSIPRLRVKSNSVVGTVIAQNDTSLPMTTFPWFRRMSILPWRHFMKVTEKTPNLEESYLELCNSVWPHICTVGKVFVSTKTFQKTPKSKNAQKYPKNEFFDVYVSFLKETRVRMRLSLYNSHVRLKYATFCIATHIYLLVYAIVDSATRVRLLKM